MPGRDQRGPQGRAFRPAFKCRGGGIDQEAVMPENGGTIEEKKGRRNIFFLGLVSFFNDFASEMIYPLLPLFLTTVLKAGAASIGVIEGVAETTASILKFFSGYWSDRYRKRKPIFASGYAVSNAVRPLIGVAGSWWHVLLLRFSDRVGKGIRTAPRDALMADSAKEGKRGLVFGFQRAMDNAGAIMGPLAAALLLPLLHNDLRTLFFLSAIPGVLALVFVFFFVREVRPKKSAARLSIRDGLAGVDANFRYYLVVVLLFTLGNSSDAFLLLRASAAGITQAYIPILWMVLHIVKTATGIPGGFISDKIGRKKVIVSGWVVYAAIYVAFAFVTTSAGIWVLFGLYGIYFGLTEGAERALVADLVGDDRRGTAYGLFNLTVGIGALPSSIIFGIVWQYAGFGYAFVMGAGFALAASVMLLFVRPVRAA
jgi:MFS family permease